MRDPAAALQTVSNWFLVLLAAHLGLGEVLGRLGLAVPPSRYLWNTLILEPMVTTGLVALPVFYVLLVPAAGKRAAILALGLLLEVLLEPARQAFHGPSWEHYLTWGSGLGLAGAAGLLWEICWNPSLRGQAWLYLKLAGIPPLAKAGAGWMMIWQQQHFGPVADNMAWAFESAWGVQPSVHLGRLFYWSDWTYAFLSFVYVGLSLWISLAVVAWLRSGRDLDFEPFSAFAVCGAVGSWFYSVVPLVGPQVYLGARFLKGDYPLVPNHLAWIEAPSSFPRNGFPSLHAAWIFLVGAVLWPLGRKARLLATFLVLTTLVASVGYGTHYLVDFVAAVPLYYGTRSLCSGFRPAWVVGALLQFALLWALGQSILQVGALLASHPWTPLGVQAVVVGLSFAIFRTCERLD